MKKYHLLYKTTCLINDKFYIGAHSTNDLNDGYLGSGKHLVNAIRKYGIHQFKREIIEQCESKDKLYQRESEIVTEELLRDPQCMNLTKGGSGPDIETSVRGGCLTQVLRKKEPWRWKTDSYKKSQSEKLLSAKFDWRNRKHSEETLKKMRDKKVNHGLGKNNSQYGTCWISNETTSTKIRKEELESYLEKGWTKGRRLRDATGSVPSF